MFRRCAHPSPLSPCRFQESRPRQWCLRWASGPPCRRRIAESGTCRLMQIPHRATACSGCEVQAEKNAELFLLRCTGQHVDQMYPVYPLVLAPLLGCSSLLFQGASLCYHGTMALHDVYKPWSLANRQILHAEARMRQQRSRTT